MSWLDKRVVRGIIKLGLAITLLALILFSCEEPNSLGEELRKDTLRVHSVNLAVTAGIYKRDSFTMSSEPVLVGEYNDPNFGKIYAEGYSSLSPVSLTVPSNIASATYDSITIGLKIHNVYGRDVEAPQDLRIYQLQDTIHYNRIIGADTVFDAYVFSRRPYERLLGEKSIRILETQPSENTFKYDSIYLRFRLDDGFGLQIFNKAKEESDAFTSSQRMREFLKGLAFVPGENTNAVFSYNLFDARSLVTLHYHTSSDTLAYTFKMMDINSSSNFSFSHVQGDLSQTPLRDLEPKKLFVSPDQKLYVQSGTLISSVLDFGAILELKETIDQPIVINNAMLYIDVEPFWPHLKPPRGLGVIVVDSLGNTANVQYDSLSYYFYTIDEDGRAQISQDFQPYRTEFLGEQNRYAMDVTLFLQEMINRPNSPRKLALLPNATFNKFKNPLASSSLDQFIVDLNKIKLRVFYTTL